MLERARHISVKGDLRYPDDSGSMYADLMSEGCTLVYLFKFGSYVTALLEQVYSTVRYWATTI